MVQICIEDSLSSESNGNYSPESEDSIKNVVVQPGSSIEPCSDGVGVSPAVQPTLAFWHLFGNFRQVLRGQGLLHSRYKSHSTTD